jgi:YjbE family integral membrane protein
VDTTTQLFNDGVPVGQASFWVASLEIVWINLVLSGDNVLLIALACRALPSRQRYWGLFLGALLAMALRIALTITVSQLMALPYLRLIGGVALLYIAVRLLATEHFKKSNLNAANIWRAVRLIVYADVVMSFDNVVAVAAVAKGNILLLIFGLGTSIPLVLISATLIVRLLNRFPILVWAGGALLGWISGNVTITDPLVLSYLFGNLDAVRIDQIVLVSSGSAAILALTLGWTLRRSRRTII